MKVAKWGNSLAVRIPADVAQELGLTEGDNVTLCALDQEQVAVVTEQQRRRAALDRLRELAVPMPPGFMFDREEANAR